MKIAKRGSPMREMRCAGGAGRGGIVRVISCSSCSRLLYSFPLFPDLVVLDCDGAMYGPLLWLGINSSSLRALFSTSCGLRVVSCRVAWSCIEGEEA